MTDEEREGLRTDVSKLMESYVEQASLLGKELFICPLAPDDFRWLISNPNKGLIGITGICPSAKPYSDERFCCIIVNSKKALYHQSEGFSISDIVDNTAALHVVPAKDILSMMI